MEARIDPRGNLPTTMIQPLPYLPRPLSNMLGHEHRRSSTNTLQKPKRNQCFDWIFSSSSNVHVAVDRAAFTTYHSFESYVLTLSDQTRVAVRGIGTVELRIRCKPGSRSHRIIILDNVLHIPDWLCNIFSDVYFQPIPGFDFAWTEFGVNFFVRDGEKMKPCGYTENFRGLDRLVLFRKHEGRSPMLEDKDREVFAVNVTWPQSQINRWEDWAKSQSECRPSSDRGSCDTIANEGRMMCMSRGTGFGSRVRLNEISGNVTLPRNDQNGSRKNLRASISSMSLSQFAKKMM